MWGMGFGVNGFFCDSVRSNIWFRVCVVLVVGLVWARVEWRDRQIIVPETVWCWMMK